MNKEFYVSKREQFSTELCNNSIALIYSGKAPHRSADENYEFCINRNFYYLTGIEEEDSVLLISKSGKNIDSTLFIPKEDPVWKKWIGSPVSPEEATKLSGIANIVDRDDFESHLNRLLNGDNVENIYLDIESNSWDEPARFQHKLAEEIKTRFPHIAIRNAHHNLALARSIKSAEEIAKMKEAVEVTKNGIEAMLKNARPGMGEYELEAHFDFVLTSSGKYPHAFPSIVATGKNATILHYGKNSDKTNDGDLVLLDLGAAKDNYCADISRTFPVNGKFTERQRQIYNIVLNAEKKVIEAVKPGLPFPKLQEIARNELFEGLKSIGLVKEISELSNYYYHGVSHHLGLDAHDLGDRRGELKPGMVITVEPGLYIEEEGIGIRIEDDILVTKKGYENLSSDIPKTVEEIEDLMK